MDKNDPFNRPGGNEGANQGEEHDFIDDARYDDPNAPQVREEEYAAGQEEWDQPIDEFAEEEQPAGAEPQPKHDPFAEEGPVEDEFTEHAETEQDVEGSEEAEPSPRTSESMMANMKPPANLMKYAPYIGGGLAAVVVAFFGLQFLGGESPPISGQPSLENQNTWDSASANPSQQNNTQQAANEFQPLQQQPEQPVQPAPQPSSTSTNMITPTTEQPQNTQAPLPQAETTQAPAQQQAPSALEARITELTQQLDTMKQTQDQLNQKLQAATATPPSMDESSKAAQQALVDRIAQLEQKLSSSQSSSSSASDIPAPSVDAPVGKASRKAKRPAPTTDDASSDTTHSSKKASVDFMAAKKSKRSKKRSSVEANSTSGTEGYSPTNSQSFQGWILRSAQPGSAWLSQGPYSSDLRRVVPGDKVQGLGTVTAIRQVAGRWVVEGTQGAVR